MGARGIVAGALVLVVTGALTGCSSSPEVGAGGCVPRIDVAPRTVHPGDSVTVSTTDVCDVPVPEGGWVVTAGQPVPDSVEVPVRTTEPLDGSWSVVIPLPGDFPTGEGFVAIDNWDYSTCPDGASCAGPFGDFTVTATPTATPTAAPTPTPTVGAASAR